jgi:hypothetical protein
MKLPKLARAAGLSLILSVASLTAFAAKPAPKPCGCSYCSHTSTQTSCTFDGTATTCGDFLAVTLCQPVG